ncbi:response regulator transcription factor [Streptomyces sp. NPDC056528]|uniref:helix-turn-helix transcriptional regulator n=1 Tax=Streptomyces sp. NPDC056528 TaxID=3345854 RepID=UPI0036938F30
MGAHARDSDDLARMLYWTADKRLDWDAVTVGPEVGVEPEQVERAVGRLAELGLLVPAPDMDPGYVPARPEQALMRLLSLEEQILEEARSRLASSRDLVGALMRNFPMQSRADKGAHIELLLSGDEVNCFIESRADGLRYRQLAMHPGGAPPQELVDEMVLRDTEVLSRGVEIKALYPHHIARTEYVRDYLTEVTHQGGSIRLAPYLPIRMIVVDDQLAILPIDPKDSSKGAFAIQSSEVARSLVEIFDFHWHSASAFPEGCEGESFGRFSLTSQEQAIVRMLAMGAKDESVARQLSISPRTLSRIVSALLDRLGVQSRFQAAVQLTRAGLLDTREK